MIPYEMFQGLILLRTEWKKDTLQCYDFCSSRAYPTELFFHWMVFVPIVEHCCISAYVLICYGNNFSAHFTETLPGSTNKLFLQMLIAL
jgi:hypothetical protein